MNSLQWFEFIASYAIQAILLVATAAALDRWTVAASVKSRIWNACFLSLLGLIAVGLMLPRLHLFHPWSTLQPKSLLLVAQYESVLGTSLLVVWFFGMGVMLIRWTLRFFTMHHFIRSCPVLSASQRESALRDVPQELLTVGGRPVELRICPEDFGPFCYQFHQPIVFLPASLFEVDHEILTHVMYHELTHLQTQHPLHLFCQRTVQSLLWFHPLVWISSRRAGLVREFVCDDASVLHAHSTTAYLRALVTVAEDNLKRQEGTLAISPCKGELLTRVRRLAQESPSSRAGRGSFAMIAVLIAAALCSQIWLPTDPLSSDRSNWSPWPSWTSQALHAVNISVRDYETFKHGNQLHEWIEASIRMDHPSATP